MLHFTLGVLDTETTGFYPKRGDRLIEVAAIKFSGEDISNAETYAQLVHPERDIPSGSTRVHGITNDDVQGAPIFSDIVPNLASFLEGIEYLFIHNAGFDISFLEEECRKINASFVLPKVICSVELSKALNPQESTHSLSALAKRYNVQLQEGASRHRALGDVFLTADVLLHMYRENPLYFLGTLDHLVKNIRI